MIYETSPSFREEKTEKTELGSKTEAKHKRVRKSGGKARNRDSETSERAQYAISPSAQLVTSESQGRSKMGCLHHKSVVCGVGLPDSLIKDFASLLNCKTQSLPFKFLGLPLGSSPSRKKSSLLQK
ncbi:hypothetical protein CsSME_00048272 [Camellia sinensis var. sinensis]